VVTGEAFSAKLLYKDEITARSQALNAFAANRLPAFHGGFDPGQRSATAAGHRLHRRGRAGPRAGGGVRSRGRRLFSELRARPRPAECDVQRDRALSEAGRTVPDGNSNPACDFPASPSYRKYGFEASVVGPFREGAPITRTFHLEDGPLNVENYFLNVEIHEEALHAAGFRDVRWHQPMLSPAGDVGCGRDYWSTLLDHPPVIFIECFLAKS
jgi:hypothetical protein